MSTADRKSTRLNSSHGYISYAVFCLKKKSPREHAEVRGGDPSHEPRHFLGSRRHGGLVAGRLPFHLRPRGRLLRRIPAGGDVGPAAGPRVKFLRAAGRQVLGLFVGDWLQSGVGLGILAAGWLGGLR